MQMKSDVASRSWVIAGLVLLVVWGMTAAFMAGILRDELPSSGSKFSGGVFLALGALLALFYKAIGRKLFAKTQSGRLFAKFWARIGERRCQFLYLGIGVILAAGGCVLIIIGHT